MQVSSCEYQLLNWSTRGSSSGVRGAEEYRTQRVSSLLFDRKGKDTLCSDLSNINIPNSEQFSNMNPLLVQVHKKLGNTHLALMYFSWATDLDPKGVNSQIKEAILSPGQGDDDSPATQSGTVKYILPRFSYFFQF